MTELPIRVGCAFRSLLINRRAGDWAALRLLEFFTLNIGNPNARAAYARAAVAFLRWCEGQGIHALGSVQSMHLAAYIELLQGKCSVPKFVALPVEDYFPQKKRSWLRLHEKNDKLNEMPCDHKIEEYLDAFFKAARIGSDLKGLLFSAAIGKTAQISARPMLCGNAWRIVRRRAADAGIEATIGCHTFRGRDYGLPHQRWPHRPSCNAWPGTRTRKRPGFMTGAMTM